MLGIVLLEILVNLAWATPWKSLEALENQRKMFFSSCISTLRTTTRLPCLPSAPGVSRGLMDINDPGIPVPQFPSWKMQILGLFKETFLKLLVFRTGEWGVWQGWGMASGVAGAEPLPPLPWDLPWIVHVFNCASFPVLIGPSNSLENLLIQGLFGPW